MLVIDEADEMLSSGFKIYDIYRYLPPLQVVLISATMPQEVLDMTKLFMNEPIQVLVQRDSSRWRHKAVLCSHRKRRLEV